jgi:hypothetical protein
LRRQRRLCTQPPKRVPSTTSAPQVAPSLIRIRLLQTQQFTTTVPRHPPSQLVLPLSQFITLSTSMYVQPALLRSLTLLPTPVAANTRPTILVQLAALPASPPQRRYARRAPARQPSLALPLSPLLPKPATRQIRLDLSLSLPFPVAARPRARNPTRINKSTDLLHPVRVPSRPIRPPIMPSRQPAARHWLSSW